MKKLIISIWALLVFAHSVAYAAEDCTWYSVFVRNNWGTDGVLFYFVQGKNKRIDTSYYNTTPTGFSENQTIKDLNLAPKETINLCLKRVGTHSYSEYHKNYMGYTVAEPATAAKFETVKSARYHYDMLEDMHKKL